MLIAIEPKIKPVKVPSFTPLIHPPINPSLYLSTASPKEIININTKEHSIIAAIPFFASALLGSIFTKRSQGVAKKALEYHIAPSIKKASAPQRIASQFRLLKNEVYIKVGFGLMNKLI